MSDKEFTPTEPILVDTPEGDEPKLSSPKESTAPVPSPEQPPQTAPPAPHSGLSVDERAFHQYESLAQVVLDSADIASKSTAAAAAASRDLYKATSDFKTLTEAGHKKAVILLGATSAILLICLIFFLVMGVRMNSRINQLDTMMLAVGKRVVDLNAGLESLDTVNRSIESLTAQQGEQAKIQGQMETRINDALKKSETMVQTVPGETAKQVAANSDNLLKQVQGINSRLQTQAGAVQSLGNEVKALKSAVGNVDNLNRDVQALVTLQKERYLETIQKNNSASNRERAVQYPRVNPAAATAPAPAPAPSASASASPAPAPTGVTTPSR